VSERTLVPFADTYELADSEAGAAREEALKRLCTSDGRLNSARALWEDGWDEACLRAKKELEQARAEVPEWCQHIVRFVHATDQGRWRDVLTETRLRACGIYVH
jgi:hypothetical protein